MGTRLKSVIPGIPKPMADINGKPFLEFILKQLLINGIERVILSVGYQYQVIQDYFGKKYDALEIIYSIEDEPLGTGGAIKLGLEKADNENLFIMNGDSLFLLDLSGLMDSHLKSGSDLTIALKPMQDFERYGTVELDQRNRITGFSEKKFCKNGLVNGGVYAASKNMFSDLNLPQKFSFEKDFLEKELTNKKITGQIFDSYFIDIGIPEDYERSKKELLSCF